ncbi:permease [Pseudorhodoplanes sp.]|uniref:permease n=1 Tax=Pseudorhodoplanes sp. TaxID=1934341 RepID=UPI002B8BB0A2|nr:permease [Pseudorhodoplanes sp.]HWV55160.1 permease [Pseudorhodoplanes sp.]
MQADKPQPARRKRKTFDWPTAVLIAIVVSAAAYVFWRDGAARFFDVIWSDADLFVWMLPNVLAGCLIAALVTILLPRDTVSRWVGRDSGLKGILISAGAGIIVPGGPFTIYPIAAAFLGMGADVAAVVTLITSWTTIGMSRALVWELPFLGFDFVLWRWLAALPLAILAGLIVRAIERYWRAGAKP